MSQNTLQSGVLLDDVALNLDELAQACGVEPEWVVRHVEAGVLGEVGRAQMNEWRFVSGDLYRARQLLALERTFEANEDIAALVLDLGDEIRRLRTRLYVLGVK